MRSILLIFLLLVSGVFAYGQQRVFNSNNKFSIIPIENWENHSEDSSLVFSQSSQGALDLYSENIQIATFPADGKTLDEIWNSWVIEDFPNSFNNYEVMGTGVLIINNKTVRWVDFKNRDFNLNFRDLAFLIVDNDVLYYIICLSLEMDFEKTRNDFFKMINTLEIY
ncbi:MAG: hypothetical protein AB7V36_00520 [Bacteroidales bacterium]